jgi:hypothetical protein
MTEIIYKKESYAIIGACFGLGLLANFGHYPQLEYQRIAKTRSTNTRSDFPDVSL